MTNRPRISFPTPAGLALAFGLSTALWTGLVCAVVILGSPAPKDYLPTGLRHFGHQVRVHMAEIYGPLRG